MTEDFLDIITSLEKNELEKRNDAEPENARRIVLCIVKLRVLKAVLDSKFKINGKSEKLPTHPDIPTDGATPFRIFWASVMKYRPIYF